MAKCETNAQRTAREYERRKTLELAKGVGLTIRQRRENTAESSDWSEFYTWIGQVFCELHRGNAPQFLRLVADMLEGKPPHSPGAYWYDDAIKAAYKEACMLTRCAFLDGELGCHLSSDAAIIPFLDRKAGLYLSSGEGIIPLPSGEIIKLIPPISLVFDIFYEQNSKLPRPPSDRSLRRSLQRLGLQTLPGKSGRPKEK
jgi:hypothetical protein